MARVHLAVAVHDPGPGLVVVVHGEHHAGTIGVDRVEERVRVGETRALHRVSDSATHTAARAPTPPRASGPSGRVGPSVRYRTTAACLASSGFAIIASRNALANAPRPSSAAARSRARTSSGSTPSSSTSRRVDLRLGQRAFERFDHGRPQVEGILGELQREERRLPLLELARGGEDVVGAGAPFRSSRRR